MKSSERRAASRLPVSASPWEVMLMPTPVTITGVEVEGLLVVVEQASGLVRAAGPVVRGSPLTSVLQLGFFQPAPPALPARPGRLLCVDADLAARLRGELRDIGIRVEQVVSVPAAEAALQSLASFMGGPPPAPGITADLDRWASALQHYCRLAPWEELADSVAFRFAGSPALDGRVGIVIGLAGAQQGFVLFDSVRSWMAFTVIAETGGEISDDIAAGCVYIDTAEVFDVNELVACRKAGLGLPGGRFPRAISMRGGAGFLLDHDEQRRLLAALEAVNALCGKHLATMEGVPARAVAETVLGRIEVSSSPAFDDDDAPLFEPIVDGDHAVAMGRGRTEAGEDIPALVLKMRKPDAHRVASRLHDADGLRVEVRGDARVLLAMEGSDTLGLLAVTEGPDFNLLLDRASRLRVCVSAGGATRRRVDEAEFVWASDLAIRKRTEVS